MTTPRLTPAQHYARAERILLDDLDGAPLDNEWSKSRIAIAQAHAILATVVLDPVVVVGDDAAGRAITEEVTDSIRRHAEAAQARVIDLARPPRRGHVATGDRLKLNQLTSSMSAQQLTAYYRARQDAGVDSLRAADDLAQAIAIAEAILEPHTEDPE